MASVGQPTGRGRAGSGRRTVQPARESEATKGRAEGTAEVVAGPGILCICISRIPRGNSWSKSTGVVGAAGKRCLTGYRPGLMEAGGGLEEAPSTEPRNLGLVVAAAGVRDATSSLLLIPPTAFPSTSSVPGTAKEQDSPAAIPKDLTVQPDGHKRSPWREASHSPPVPAEVSRVEVGDTGVGGLV